MGDSLDGSENAAEAHNVVAVDFQDFANYLRRAATVLLPEDDIVPPALNAALDDKVYQDCIRKFISDPQVPSLFVQRFSLKGTSHTGIAPIPSCIPTFYCSALKIKLLMLMITRNAILAMLFLISHLLYPP